MSPLMQVGLLLVNTIGSLFALVVLMRFLLQLVRADFYNPISQFVVKVTNPLLLPLRRVVPGFAGLDVASLLLAWLVQCLYIGAIGVMLGLGLPWANILVWGTIGLVSLLFNIYFWGLLIVVIASWIAPNSYNPALILINQLLEPVMAPIRAKMPDMGGLDLSPLIFILALKVAEILLLTPLYQLGQVPMALANVVIGL
ncbi:YggT family protein [Bacterioplanes sanyensis]|uniref:YggT family protein n=1 Tax=Bacterioplanes sanyensis TaxID=1249553 RepID=A0A222FI36_9GAMM|nr:YggT family protein [Bacterioplanes sanyensis]ASP38144.1 YggT family protein [Bacterioplanes sanyensis]